MIDRLHRDPLGAVDADVSTARPPDARFYRSGEHFALARERVFARSWQWLGDLDAVRERASLAPRTLLPGLLDEPLLLARDAEGTLRCLSNVCTHRGNLLVHTDAQAEGIRCAYHSRRFDLAGRMTFMPGFDGVAGFPSADDDLPQVPFAAWANLGFASVDPSAPFDTVFAPVREALAHAPLDRLARDPARDREYAIDAHWALYVENYLEGLHIPFVHPGLASSVSLDDYRVDLYPHAVLQTAYAKPGEAGFAPGPDGRRVAALYWWVFPNLMLNFYPWGLSLNHVRPLAPGRTAVVYRGYVWDAAMSGQGAGGALDCVEAEDQAIVEAVQRGVSSRLYRGGRYSVAHERGVHHFHRLLTAAWAEAPG